MDETARRILGKRQTCDAHGTTAMAYDLTSGGWTCLGEGSHDRAPRTAASLTPAMIEDLKRLGIDPEPPTTTEGIEAHEDDT